MSGPAIPAAKQLTPNKIQAGPALAVQIVDDAYIAIHGLQAGKSIPVYQVTTGKVEAGPVVPVYFTEGGVTVPVANFSANVTSGVESLTVQFTDLSTNTPTSWDWNFGDLSAHSSLQNPSHTYSAPGTYTVTLIATNAAGSDTEIKVAYITVLNWYRAGGAPAPTGAYRGKGAASYAASKVNLANPGVNNLAEGNGAVTWNASTGWQFAGSPTNKYFNTGILATATTTTLCQFSGVVGTALVLYGSSDGANAQHLIYPARFATQVGYRYGNGAPNVTPQLAAGNLGMAGATGYRNGAQDAAAIGVFSGTGKAIYVGANNNNGSPATYIVANIQAFVVYSGTLTPSQVAAVAAAMAAL